MEPSMDGDACDHGLFTPPVRPPVSVILLAGTGLQSRGGADAPAAQLTLVTETRGT
jgi:hypothetical protein